jgi:hypothetical protein
LSWQRGRELNSNYGAVRELACSMFEREQERSM